MDKKQITSRWKLNLYDQMKLMNNNQFQLMVKIYMLIGFQKLQNTSTNTTKKKKKCYKNYKYKCIIKINTIHIKPKIFTKKDDDYNRFIFPNYSDS